MKKKSLLLIVALCVLMLFCSASVFALDYESVEKTDKAVTTVTPFAVTPSAVTEFSDVAAGDWFYQYVSFTTANGIFQGFPEGVFKPNEEMTRAQVARVIYAMEGEPEVTGKETFKDVPVGEWYYKPVEWAAAAGVVSGYPDGSFKPQLSISRQDFVSMLYRYADMKGYDVTKLADLNFPDKDNVNDYAVTPFRWAIANGIINGIPVNNVNYLKPADITSRAQVAKMLSVFAVEYMEMGEITDVTISPAEYTVAQGGSVVILPTVTPETGYSEMTWTSSDQSVATVERGVVKGVSEGTATITATAFDGKKATCTVKVTADAYSMVCNYIKANGHKDTDTLYTYYFDDTYVDDGMSELLTYGINYDTKSDCISLYSIVIDSDNQYKYVMQMPMPRNTATYTASFDFETLDYFYQGTAKVQASTYKESTILPFADYKSNDSSEYQETKDLMNDLMNYELSSTTVLFGEILTEDIGTVTLKDFGFTSF